MFLSDKTIKEYLDKGIIVVKPTVDSKDIRPTGIRIHLGREILFYEDGQTVDPQKPDAVAHKVVNLGKSPFVIGPGQFVIGHTLEKIKAPRDMLGFLDGRSTLARLGLTVHITAAIVDGLYEGGQTITLEIKNESNLSLKLSYKMAIGSLMFTKIDNEIAQEIQKQYKVQDGLTPPNLKTQLE